MPTNPLLVNSYTSSNLNRQYQNGKNTIQNQKKNACSFYTFFQALEVLLIKICKIQPLGLSFSLAFTLTDIIFYKFLKLHSALSERKIFVTNFPFLTESLNPHPPPPPPSPPPTPLNSQNPLNVKRLFC